MNEPRFHSIFQISAENRGNCEPVTHWYTATTVNYRQPHWHTLSHNIALSVAYLTEWFSPKSSTNKSICLFSFQLLLLSISPNPHFASAVGETTELNRLRAGGRDQQGSVEAGRQHGLCSVDNTIKSLCSQKFNVAVLWHSELRSRGGKPWQYHLQ